MSQFSWPKYPQADEEFDALMGAIDDRLSAEGIHPPGRLLHLGLKFWEAFQWNGQMMPSRELANAPGFEGDVLMAKSVRWYEQIYGDKLNIDLTYGYVPVKLGNALWRVRASVTCGSVELFLDPNLSNRGNSLASRGNPSSLNVLCAVEDLTQGLVNRLSQQGLTDYFNFYISTFQSLQWYIQLPGTDLLDAARGDFAQCTADVMAQRYLQARWAAEQAVEKTLKGFLALGSIPFPRGGPNGHNLKHLAELLKSAHAISINPTLLEAASCSAGVRYREEPSTEAQALLANHAVLAVLEQLRSSSKISDLLALAEERLES